MAPRGDNVCERNTASVVLLACQTAAGGTVSSLGLFGPRRPGRISVFCWFCCVTLLVRFDKWE